MNSTMTTVTLILCIVLFLGMLLVLVRQGNHHRGTLDLARQHREGIHYLTQRLAAVERAVTGTPSQAKPVEEEQNALKQPRRVRKPINLYGDPDD